MKKKIFASALALLLLVTAFAACGKKDDAGNGDTTAKDTAGIQTGEGDTTRAPESTEAGPDIPDSITEGFCFSILNYAPGGGYSKSVLDLAYEDIVDQVDEAIYKRNRQIEDKWGCTINVMGVDKPHETMNSLVASNDDSADLCMVYEENIGLVLQNVNNWQSIPYLSLDADWWNVGSNEAFTIHGYQFAATGDFSLSHYNKIYALFYNKDLYQTYTDGTDLYELVNTGSWTCDELFRIGALFDRNLDGDPNVVSEDDGHGVSATSKLMFSILFHGADGRMVGDNSDGEPSFVLQETKNVNVLSSILEYGAKYYNYQPGIPNGSIDYDAAGYSDGNTLFMASILSNADATRDYSFSTGYMPAPKLNEEQQGYHSISIGGNVAVLPRTLSDERSEDVGAILELMSYLSRETVIAEYRETYLKTKLADSDDAEMIQLLFDTVAFDLGNNLFFRDARLAVNRDIFCDLNTNFGSALDIIAGNIDSKIGDYIGVVDSLIEIGG